MAAHQAPPSLRFSRQEYCSGLPFPSPMHESEKWKWSRSVMSDSSQPHGLQASLSMGFSRQEYWSGVPLPCLILVQRPWQFSCCSSMPGRLSSLSWSKMAHYHVLYQGSGSYMGQRFNRRKGQPPSLRVLTRSYTYYFCQSIDVWKVRLENVVVNLSGHVPSQIWGVLLWEREEMHIQWYISFRRA